MILEIALGVGAVALAYEGIKKYYPDTKLGKAVTGAVKKAYPGSNPTRPANTQGPGGTPVLFNPNLMLSLVENPNAAVVQPAPPPPAPAKPPPTGTGKNNLVPMIIKTVTPGSFVNLRQTGNGKIIGKVLDGDKVLADFGKVNDNSGKTVKYDSTVKQWLFIGDSTGLAGFVRSDFLSPV